MIAKEISQYIYLKESLAGNEKYILNDKTIGEDHNGWGVAHLILKNNKYLKLKFTDEQWIELFQKSSKKELKDGWDHLMMALTYNSEQNLNISADVFDYLVNNSNLIKINEQNHNALLFALMYYNESNVKYSYYFWKKLILNSELNAINYEGYNVLMAFLKYSNEKEFLNFPSDLFPFLIANSNLQVLSIEKENTLMLLLESKYISLDEKLIDMIIENTNLNQENSFGKNSLMVALEEITKNNNILSKNQIKYLIDNTKMDSKKLKKFINDINLKDYLDSENYNYLTKKFNKFYDFNSKEEKVDKVKLSINEINMTNLQNKINEVKASSKNEEFNKLLDKYLFLLKRFSNKDKKEEEFIKEVMSKTINFCNIFLGDLSSEIEYQDYIKILNKALNKVEEKLNEKLDLMDSKQKILEKSLDF